MVDDKLIKGSSRLLGTLFKFNIGCFKFDIDFIQITPFPPGFGYSNHMHSDFELHYIVAGNGTIALEDNEYKVEKGDFFVTGPNVAHWQIADDKTPMIEYCLKGSFDLSENEDNQVLIKEAKRLIDVLTYDAKRVIKNCKDIETIFKKIYMESAEREIGYYQNIQNLIYELFIAAGRKFLIDISEYKVDEITLDEFRLKRINLYIDDNMRDSITYDDIAKHIFVSNRHLSRIIKKQTGMTMHDYILKHRIKRVKYYLQNTSKTLRQIAMLTGFANEFHLSRIIKKYTGKTPTQLKKQLIEELPTQE